MIGILVTFIHIVVCFVLIVVILIQGGRGQGLTGPSFASGNVQSLLGTRAADFLTKATTISAIFFLFTCIGLNIIETRKSKSLLEGSKSMAPVDIDAVKKALEQVKAEQTTPAAVAGTVDKATAATAETQANANAVVDEAAKAASNAGQNVAGIAAQVAAKASESAAPAVTASEQKSAS